MEWYEKDLNKIMSGEDQHQEATDLVECRMAEMVDELQELVKEIDGEYEGSIDGKVLIMEHLEAIL